MMTCSDIDIPGLLSRWDASAKMRTMGDATTLVTALRERIEDLESRLSAPLPGLEEGDFTKCSEILDDWFNSCNVQGTAEMETVEVEELLAAMIHIEKLQDRFKSKCGFTERDMAGIDIPGLLERAQSWLESNDVPERAIFHTRHTAELIRELKRAIESQLSAPLPAEVLRVLALCQTPSTRELIMRQARDVARLTAQVKELEEVEPQPGDREQETAIEAVEQLQAAFKNLVEEVKRCAVEDARKVARFFARWQ